MVKIRYGIIEVIMEVFNIEYKNDNTNNLDILNTIISSLFILLLSSLMPILIFFLPGPSIALSVKNGQKYGIFSIIAIIIAMIYVMDFKIAIIFALYILPMVSIMSMMIKQKTSFNKIVIYNFIAFLFITLMAYLNLKYILNIDIIGEITNYFDELMANIINVMEKSDIEYLEYSIKNIKASIQLVKFNLPAISIIIALSFIFISLTYAMNSLRKRGVDLNQKYRFIHYRISEKLIIPIILLGALVYMATYFKIPNYNMIMYNAVTLFSFIFLVAGIALVDYYFIGKLPKALRLFIPILLIFFARGDLLFLGIGFLDMIVNFRKRFKRIENEKY